MTQATKRGRTKDTLHERQMDLCPPSWNSNARMPDNLIQTYFSQLEHIEHLSADEQQRLARQFLEEGDEDAGQRLLVTNLRLVVKLAHEYKREWSDLPDLVQAGNLGLAEALKRYEPDRDVKFISYAQYWIRAMIMSHLKANAHPVKMCTTRAGRTLFYNLDKTKKELRREGQKPTPKRIAERLDIDPEDVRKIGINLQNAPLSLNRELLREEQTTFGDLLADPRTDPSERAARSEILERVGHLVEQFTDQIEDERKLDIWQRRTTSTDPVTLRELGTKWDVSKERIRQVELDIKKQFKQQLRAEFGGEIEDFFDGETLERDSTSYEPVSFDLSV